MVEKSIRLIWVKAPIRTIIRLFLSSEALWKSVKLALILLQQKTVKLAAIFLQQKTVKWAATVKNGKVNSDFTAAKTVKLTAILPQQKW